MKASSLDEAETSQSESEPESPAHSPELDLIGSYLLYPGQGELKTGRPAFSFSEPPFATRPEIQQELICWEGVHRPGEAALTPRSWQLIGLDPTRGLAGGLLYWLPVPLRFLWGGLCVFDTSVCLYMPIFADLWLLGRNEKQEKGQGTDAAAAVSVGCAAAWKWTEQNGNGLNRPWLFHSCMNTAFFPTSLTFQVVFRGETGFSFLRK